MRLFVALQISDEVRGAIAQLIRELKPLDDSWKWTRAENLHVTLKFLGETPESKLENITRSLSAVPADLPITLNFKGLGFFPNERRPRVLWVGMEAPQSLSALAAAIDDSLSQLEILREDRAFTPHLTLSRSKEGRISSKLREALAKYSTSEFKATEASKFHLIESKIRSTGAEYTTLQSFSGAPKAK